MRGSRKIFYQNCYISKVVWPSFHEISLIKIESVGHLNWQKYIIRHRRSQYEWVFITFKQSWNCILNCHLNSNWLQCAPLQPLWLLEPFIVKGLIDMFTYKNNTCQNLQHRGPLQFLQVFYTEQVHNMSQSRSVIQS